MEPKPKIKKYICINCGQEINEIEVNNGYIQKFETCSCNALRLLIPIEHYNSYTDIKCPHCHKYPFKDKPLKEEDLLNKFITISDDDVENII